jgi:site-specific DNA-cytosine methylase
MMRGLRARLEERSGLAYDLYHVMHDAYILGGAALRPRYFFVASRVPFGVDWPSVRRPVLRDAWGDLDGLSLTWQRQPYRRPPTWWTEHPRGDAEAVDGHAGISTPYIRRALDLLENNGGWPEGWHIGKVARDHYGRAGSLPSSWDVWKDRLLASDFHMGYTSMTRWVADRPARVITGGALGLVLHPWENRTITHREAARVMGFPDDWRILPLRGASGLQMTWGKGITVQCGEWIGRWVRDALDGRPGPVTGELIGDRERLIRPPKVRTSHLKARPAMIASTES